MALSHIEHNVNYVVCFYFANAFDSVNHDILLIKLKDVCHIDGS